MLVTVRLRLRFESAGLGVLRRAFQTVAGVWNKIYWVKMVGVGVCSSISLYCFNLNPGFCMASHGNS